MKKVVFELTIFEFDPLFVKVVAELMAHPARISILYLNILANNKKKQVKLLINIYFIITTLNRPLLFAIETNLQ